jgi:hypothetical protein
VYFHLSLASVLNMDELTWRDDCRTFANETCAHWIGGLLLLQSQFGLFEEEENLMPVPGFERRAAQPIA